MDTTGFSNRTLNHEKVLMEYVLKITFPQSNLLKPLKDVVQNRSFQFMYV